MHKMLDPDSSSVAVPAPDSTAPGLRLVSQPTVAVIITNHAREDEAVRAAQSVLNQDYSGEVVVYFVYDLRPGVERLLERMPSEVVALPYVPSQGKNPIAAKRNIALSTCVESLVAFLDDDDLWYPSKLSSQVDFMLRHPDAILCCTAWNVGSGRRNLQSNPVSGCQLSSWQISLAVSIVTSTTLLDGISVRKARFDERAVWFAVEDYDLWLRLECLGPLWKLQAELTVVRPDAASASSHDRSSQLSRAASVAAEHLRRKGLSFHGIAALLWFFGRACVAERGSTAPQFAPSPVEEVLDGTVLGRADPLIAAVEGPAARMRALNSAVDMSTISKRLPPRAGHHAP